jgi:DNA-binding NarL/FixJ family response regulator
MLLADDHPGFLEMIEVLLTPTFEVVGEVSDGQSLVEEATELNPDVIISDISMPRLNGIEAAQRLKRLGSTAKIIFLTAHLDTDFVQACMVAGASGYVEKHRVYTDLLAAISEVLAGHTFISPHSPNQRSA